MTTPTRPGGRSDHSLRPLSCELACLHHSDGSAIFRSGATAVLASVRGPAAPRREGVPKSPVSVIVKSGSTVSDEREWEAFLTSVLSSALTETLPRSMVQVVVQILSDDGAVLGTALHAAVGALMDAGLALDFVPTAVTCLVTDGGISLDPCAEEEAAAGSAVIVTSNAPKANIVGCFTSGVQCSIDDWLQCTALAQQTRPALEAFWRLALEQKVKREAVTLWSS